MNEQRPVPPIPQTPRPVPPQPVQHRPAPPQGMPKIAPMPVQAIGHNDLDLEPLELVDDIAAAGVPTPVSPQPAPVAMGAPAHAPAHATATAPSVLGPNASKIKSFSVAQEKSHLTKFNRQPTVTGRGAIRVRTFHSRLSDESLAYMDDKINEWLDGHPDIEIKFTTCAIGQYDGKIKEPALVLNVWY